MGVPLMCVYCRPQPGELNPPSSNLTPRTVERHVLMSMDLLERAAELIHDQWDGTPPTNDGQRWISDFNKLKLLGDSDG